MYPTVKRLLDIILSFFAIILLSPFFLILVIAIKLDSKGPVFFTQKRVGKNKKYFKILKFRTMRIDTPHDMPTHMLKNPEMWITRVGAFLRKTSLDELPQIFNIFAGHMSIIGPRPALWNQYDLIEERDKYCANDIRPGLTGWAQINGRDELEIEVKAAYDGEYVKKMGLIMDARCFFGTILSVLSHEGVVEGGTGELHKEDREAEEIKERIPLAVGAAGAQDSAVNTETAAKIAPIPHEMPPKGKIAVFSSHTHSLFWFRMDMMRDFVNCGYKVYALGQEPEETWRDKFVESGIEYRQIYVERNGLNPLSDLKTLKSIKAFLKSEMPDKIFCYQAKTIIYTCLAAGKCKIKEVYPLVAGLGSIFRGTSLKSKLVKAVMTAEYKAALKKSKTVMFQNNDDRDAFIDSGIVKREKCRIINGSGVDTEVFTVTPMPEKTSFLMTARLIKDKGVMEYLEACKKIKEKNPDVRCLLVGPYDTNPSAITPDELSPYIENSTVEYFGEQTDVRPFIADSCVFVLPSYHEGTPKTVLESMSCGRAIITTDAPGCRETVKDGVNGFLVRVKDADAVAEKMQCFIDTPGLAEKMGLAGRKTAEEKYDIRKVNRSIMDIMSL